MERILPALGRGAAVLFVLALPTLLITSNIRFLATDARVYEYGFREYHADRVTGLRMRELDRAAREIIAYFENDQATLRIVVQDGGDEVSLFNPKETQHMEDVKGLMRLVFRLNEFSLAYVLTYVAAVFVWSRQPLRRLAQQAITGLGVGFAVIVAVGVFAVTGFDATWERFHRIAFRNDLWQLDPDTDRLIQMFPEPFWQDVTYLLGLLTITEAMIILALSLGYLYRSRDRAAARPLQAPPVSATTDVSPAP